MESKAADVRGGFNEYIKTLAADKGKADIHVSASCFDTQVRPIFADLPVSEVPKLTGKNYSPGGGTALYDAIGYGLDEIRENCLKDCGADHHPYGSKDDKYLLIIMTDGEENSSRSYDKHRVADKITRREKNGNWTFVYLGANQDAMIEGGAYGIGVTNTHTFDMAHAGYTLRSMAGTTASFANSTATATQNFAGVVYAAASPDWDAPVIDKPEPPVDPLNVPIKERIKARRKKTP
jgi:hypothetical protein